MKDAVGVTFKIVTPYGAVTLWKQQNGLWWCDLSGTPHHDTSHTPEPLWDAVARALRFAGVNKDDIDPT